MQVCFIRICLYFFFPLLLNIFLFPQWYTTTFVLDGMLS